MLIFTFDGIIWDALVIGRSMDFDFKCLMLATWLIGLGSLLLMFMLLEKGSR